MTALAWGTSQRLAMWATSARARAACRGTGRCAGGSSTWPQFGDDVERHGEQRAEDEKAQFGAAFGLGAPHVARQPGVTTA